MQSGATVEKAIDAMAEKNECPHRDGGRASRLHVFGAGCLGCHFKFKGKPFTEIELRDAMTNKLIVAEPEDEVSSCMAMMIRADIKHFPVIKEKEIIGVLTMRDLVKEHIGSLTAELHYLKDYISDLEEAHKD